jgi:hypothetical protein
MKLIIDSLKNISDAGNVMENKIESEGGQDPARQKDQGLFIPSWVWDKPIDRRGKIVRLYCSEDQPLYSFFVHTNEREFRAALGRLAEELFRHESYGEGIGFADVMERLTACGLGNASAFSQYLFGNEHPKDIRNFKAAHFARPGSEAQASTPDAIDAILGI